MISQPYVDLGALRRQYGISAGVWLNLLLGGILLAFAIQGYLSVLLGTSPARMNGPLFWYIVSGVLGITLISVWLWQRTRQVEVYDHGLRYQHGSRSITMRWEEIALIWRRSVRHSVNFIPVGTSHSFTIQTRDGERLKLTGSIGHVAHLGTAIQEATTPYLLAHATEQLQAGQTIAFGQVQVHQLGLHNGKMLLPWNEIASTSIQNGAFTVKRQGQWRTWMRLPVASIPNIVVLLTLLNQRNS